MPVDSDLQRATSRKKMDPLSVAASVAGVATLAADLSKTLYTIYHDVKGAEKETEEIASSVSILSTVLKALEDVLRNDIQTYRPEFVLHVKGISDRCERIVKDIQAVTAVKRGNNQRKSLLKKVAWCFQKDRVKHLQTSLESLKSTLNILLHVIGLARMIVGVASNGFVVLCLDMRAMYTKSITVNLIHSEIKRSRNKDNFSRRWLLQIVFWWKSWITWRLKPRNTRLKVKDSKLGHHALDPRRRSCILPVHPRMFVKQRKKRGLGGRTHMLRARNSMLDHCVGNRLRGSRLPARQSRVLLNQHDKMEIVMTREILCTELRVVAVSILVNMVLKMRHDLHYYISHLEKTRTQATKISLKHILL